MHMHLQWLFFILTHSSHKIDNSFTADWSITLEFGTEFDHMTANTLNTFKVKGSNFNTDELLKIEQIFPAHVSGLGEWPT